MNFSEMRNNLCSRTQKGTGFLLGAILFWAMMLITGLFIPVEQTRALSYFFGGAMLFPMGVFFSRALKAEVFIQNNPLAPFLGILNLGLLLYLPLLFGAYLYRLDAVPWFMAVIMGAHYLPYCWLYDSKAYLYASVVLAIGGALLGSITAGDSWVIVPGFVLFVLVVLFFWLRLETRKLIHPAQ